MAIVNPFHEDTENKDQHLFVQPDLAGPVLFGFVLGAALTLSGGETRFGCIYGLSAVSIFVMFFIVQLLGESYATKTSTSDNKRESSKLVSVSEVASVLGYSQLPIVWLAIIGIIVPLKSVVGALLGLSAVVMAARAASLQFCRIIGNQDQMMLLAYPCGLVYLVFTLIVIF